MKKTRKFFGHIVLVVLGIALIIFLSIVFVMVASSKIYAMQKEEIDSQKYDYLLGIGIPESFLGNCIANDITAIYNDVYDKNYVFNSVRTDSSTNDAFCLSLLTLYLIDPEFDNLIEEVYAVVICEWNKPQFSLFDRSSLLTVAWDDDLFVCSRVPAYCVEYKRQTTKSEWEIRTQNTDFSVLSYAPHSFDTIGGFMGSYYRNMTVCRLVPTMPQNTYMGDTHQTQFVVVCENCFGKTNIAWVMADLRFRRSS